MASQLDICNAALAELGQKDIESLNENSEGARLCSMLWTVNLDALLEEHPWGFATEMADLAVDPAVPAFGYASRCALPSNCLRVLSVEGQHRLSDYKIENGFILANFYPVSIKYVVRITDTNKFSSLFAEALAARLAWRMAKPITGSASEVELVYRIYEQRLARAKGSDASQGTPTVVDGSCWLDARN